MLKRTLATTIYATLFCGWSAAAKAHCGGGFCALVSGPEALGAAAPTSSAVDLRYEFIRQDTLRNGTRKTDPAGLPDAHDEVRTLNRNSVLTLDWALRESTTLRLQLPVVDRFHEHFHNDLVAGAEAEQWRYSEIGDISASGLFRRVLGGDLGTWRQVAHRFHRARQ